MSKIRSLWKIPLFFLKLLYKFNYQEFLYLKRNVSKKDLLKGVYGRTLNLPKLVNVQENGLVEINAHLDLLKYRIRHVKDSIYLWNYNNNSIYATYNQFVGLQLEYLQNEFDEIYAYDWNDKIVIDVGGFVGDSALHFIKHGAKKVTIYEPIPINVNALALNLKACDSKYQVHEKAVASHNDEMVISSCTEEGNPGFGISKGDFEVKCRGITFANILKETPNADVIKIDCEGGEEHLLDLSNDKLQSIPYWIVETHRKNLFKVIQVKFKECGFKKVKEFSLSPVVDLFHFELINNG